MITIIHRFVILRNYESGILNFLEETAEDNNPGFKRSIENTDILASSIDQLRKKRKLEGENKAFG